MKKQKTVKNKTENDSFLTTVGLARRAGKLVIGWDRLEKYSGSVMFNIVSCDASERTFTNAKKKAETVKTKYDMTELGHALGIEKAAVVAVVDEGFATLLKKTITDQ